MKKALLVVSFGTSHNQTCEENIGAIEGAASQALPKWELRRAFTSGMIIKKLRTRDSVVVDTVKEALERLCREGYEVVVCQPTHIINGEEYDKVAEAAERFRDRFATLVLGTPLLTDSADFSRVASAVAAHYTVPADTALCLMGHGTSHHSDTAYAALQYRFDEQGHRHVVVGTVEGYPTLEQVMGRVEVLGVSGVLLAPLMVVAGDHAINDLAGEENSWRASFVEKGYRVHCALQGLGEIPAVRDIYTDHVRRAVDKARSTLEFKT